MYTVPTQLEKALNTPIASIDIAGATTEKLTYNLPNLVQRSPPQKYNVFCQSAASQVDHADSSFTINSDGMLVSWWNDGAAIQIVVFPSLRQHTHSVASSITYWTSRLTMHVRHITLQRLLTADSRRFRPYCEHIPWLETTVTHIANLFFYL